MEDMRKADETGFASAMRERLERHAREVMAAVNAGRTGSVIDDSEGPVLELARQLERELYQAAIQARINATEAAASFSPSGPRGSAHGGAGTPGTRQHDASGAGAMESAAILVARKLFDYASGPSAGSPASHRKRGRS